MKGYELKFNEKTRVSSLVKVQRTWRDIAYDIIGSVMFAVVIVMLFLLLAVASV